MKIKIQKIIDSGIHNKERLWLKVLEDTNLEYYIVFDTIYTSKNSISNSQKNAYWFNSKQVKAGDSVVLYTKSGNYASKLKEDGTTSHFFYWGFKNPIWNNEGDCAVLLEISSWETSPYQ